MENNSLLVALSASVGRSITSEWLTAVSLAQLDYAYCSHAERTAFLELLMHMLISCNDINSFTSRFTVSRLRWMIDRGVLSTSFTYGWETHIQDQDFCTFNSFFQMNVTKLKRICIYGDDTLTSLKIDTLMDAMFAAVSAVLEELWINAALNWHTHVTACTHFARLRRVQLISLTDRDLMSICRAAPNLVEIHIDGPACSDIGFTAIAQHCRRLQIFTIWDDGNMTNVDQAVSALVQGCSQLKHLILGWCYSLTDVGLTAVATHCTCIAVLLVSDNRNITDESLIALAHSACARNLRSLTLDGCLSFNIGGEGILVIAEHCNALSTVHLSGLKLNYHYICSVIPRWQRMQSFNLSCCETNDEVLNLIGDYMPLLEYLNITPMFDEPSYTYAGVLHVVQKCAQLKILELDCDDTWTEAQVEQWMEVRPGLRID